MTEEELKTEIMAARERYNLEMNKIYKDYAFNNNPYKIGDIITDHIGSIIIEVIKWSKIFNRFSSECVYTGTQLKKNGEPFKSGEKRVV
jgi:hypothetical protein